MGKRILDVVIHQPPSTHSPTIIPGFSEGIGHLGKEFNIRTFFSPTKVWDHISARVKD